MNERCHDVSGAVRVLAWLGKTRKPAGRASESREPFFTGAGVTATATTRDETG